jgi:hypothetical protein
MFHKHPRSTLHFPFLHARDGLQVPSNKGQDLARANSRVHTGLSSCSAALPPRNKANQVTARLVNDWAAAVALARVFAARGETGAEHVGRDGTGAVVLVAGGAGDGGDVDLLESGGESGAA